MDLALHALPASLVPPLAAAPAFPAWVVLAGVAGLVLAILLADRRIFSPRRILTPEDVATSPDRPVTLRAWVERDLLPLVDPPLAGVEVRFTIAGVTTSATTDSAGKAELKIDPPGPGIHEVRVECDLASPNSLAIEVSDKPALVVDLDHTIADCSQLLFLLKKTETVRAMAGAADALKALASRYRIVYLTARDHLLRDKSRDWLRMNGFPPAPLVLRRERLWSKSGGAHKRERLAEIAGDVRLVAGVGDLASDVAAYESQKMKAIRIGGDARTWKEAEERLK